MLQKRLGGQTQALMGARLQAIKYGRSYKKADFEELKTSVVSGDRCLVRCRTGLWQYVTTQRSTLMT